MDLALRLGRRGLGNVWPNPAVGCVLVQDRVVVGRGWTQPGGRPHAETEALRRAGASASGAVAYISLEPCAHQGATPPCADALIDAGISRAVIGATDPDPRASGAGIERLRDGGVEVETGVCSDAATELNAGFFSRIERRRPLVTLKVAATLDGRIAARTGQSKWITGEGARQRAHVLRATHDGILIGSATALNDDPMLTCRLPGLGARSPIRIVVDRRRRVHRGLALIESAGKVPTWVFTLEDDDPAWSEIMRQAGAEIFELPPTEDDEIYLSSVMQVLAERGLTRVLVEGGAAVAASLCRASLADRLAVFRAPVLFGQDGLAMVGQLDFSDIADAVTFERIAVEPVGKDILETYRAAH